MNAGTSSSLRCQARRRRLLLSTLTTYANIYYINTCMIIQAPVAAFDAKPDDIYANPPSVLDTITNQLNSDVSDPSLRQAQFGPNQIAVAGGAIIFGLVFVLVSGVDFSPSNRFQVRVLMCGTVCLCCLS